MVDVSTYQDIQIRYDSEAGVTWLRLETGEEVGINAAPTMALSALVQRIRVEAGEQPTLPTRQNETLDIVRDFINVHGRSPSVRELAGRLERTHATVQQALRALERKGYITISASRRGISLVSTS